MIIFASLYLESIILFVGLMLNQPYSREMTPSELLNHNVGVIELFPQRYWMITIWAVVSIIFTL